MSIAEFEDLCIFAYHLLEKEKKLRPTTLFG
jgi:hypothetical protein